MSLFDIAIILAKDGVTTLVFNSAFVLIVILVISQGCRED